MTEPTEPTEPDAQDVAEWHREMSQLLAAFSADLGVPDPVTPDPEPEPDSTP